MSPQVKPSDNRTHKSSKQERVATEEAARRAREGESLISRRIAAIYAVYSIANGGRVSA